MQAIKKRSLQLLIPPEILRIVLNAHAARQQALLYETTTALENFIYYLFCIGFEAKIEEIRRGERRVGGRGEARFHVMTRLPRFQYTIPLAKVRPGEDAYVARLV